VHNDYIYRQLITIYIDIRLIMARILFFTFGFCLLVCSLPAQHTDLSRIDPEKRKEWINAICQQLQKIKPETIPGSLPVEQKAFEDYFRLSVRVNKEGLIVLPCKNWIYIISSSAHEDPETGDISLAIDHKKKIFMNEGHVCGGIIHFETDKIRELKTSREFFKHFVSDTDEEGWKRIR
jgi:hypothetical protein